MLTGPITRAAPESPKNFAAKLGARVRGDGPAKPQAEAAAEPNPQTQAPAKQQDGHNRGLAPEGSEQSATPAKSQEAEEVDQGAEETPPDQSGKTRRKFKALIAKTKEKEGEIEALKAEVAALRSSVQQPAQPKPQAKKRAEFAEPFPENGSLDDQRRWEIRKEAHAMVQEALGSQLQPVLGEAFGNFAQVISPALRHSVEQMANQSWAEMAPNLEAIGVSVKEVRPIVEAEIERTPGASIPEILGRVLFGKQFGEWDGETPSVEAPAKNPARPAGPARSQTGRFESPLLKGRDAVERAAELRKSGHKMQSQAVFGAYLASKVRRPR